MHVQQNKGCVDIEKFNQCNQLELWLLAQLPFGTAHEILVLTASSSNEDSGGSAHMHRLARGVAALIHKVHVWIYICKDKGQK